MPRTTARATSTKLRSRAYPVISLAESLGLLRQLKQEIGLGERNRDSIARALGYAGGHSGIASRKAAALVHFGLLSLRDGWYSPTALASEILETEDEESRRILLRDAFLNPTLFREVIHRYEPVGRVPRQLAVALHLDHGIQEHVQDEVARIFMQSAIYAGVLASDGSFRRTAPQEALKPMQVQAPVLASPPPPLEVAFHGSRQVLKFQVTDQKEVIFDLPASLDEADIPLLDLQIQFLKLQLEQNRPDRPVLLDNYRDRRKR